MKELDQLTQMLESGEEVSIGAALFDLLRQKPVNKDEVETPYAIHEKTHSTVFMVSMKGLPIGLRVEIPAYDTRNAKGLIELSNFLMEVARTVEQSGVDFEANQLAYVNTGENLQ